MLEGAGADGLKHIIKGRQTRGVAQLQTASQMITLAKQTDPLRRWN